MDEFLNKNIVSSIYSMHEKFRLLFVVILFFAPRGLSGQELFLRPENPLTAAWIETSLPTGFWGNSFDLSFLVTDEIKEIPFAVKLGFTGFGSQLTTGKSIGNFGLTFGIQTAIRWEIEPFAGVDFDYGFFPDSNSDPTIGLKPYTGIQIGFLNSFLVNLALADLICTGGVSKLTGVPRYETGSGLCLMISAGFILGDYNR